MHFHIETSERESESVITKGEKGKHTAEGDVGGFHLPARQQVFTKTEISPGSLMTRLSRSQHTPRGTTVYNVKAESKSEKTNINYI